MRILLSGYYGKANFGDDVLLKVTHGRVRQWLPDATIEILCDNYCDDYLPSLIGENLGIVMPGNREHFDLIVHGGGGTFFDFGNYGIRDRIINHVIKLAGYDNYGLLDQQIRRILGRQRISAKKRIGWGVGVGTYVSGSKKLRHNLPTLLDFDELIVRDTSSITNLHLLGLGDRATLGSDLAFLDDYWVPANARNTHQDITKLRPRLGLILRDWPSEPTINYLDNFAELLPTLDQRYNLSLFIFDKHVDNRLMALAKPYTMHIWSPPATSFVHFCNLLARQDVIVSSRAHGALCGAVLGIPAVLIGIEPKLRTIHEMLPAATSLLQPNELALPLLTDKIDESLSLDMVAITDDVARNKSLIQSTLDRTVIND